MPQNEAHRPLFVLKQHNSAVMTCAMDEIGHFPHILLSGDTDGVVKIWDLELRSVLMSFAPVNAVTGATPESRANTGVLKVGFLPSINTNVKAWEEREEQPIFFYTQCRNHSLYIWRTVLGTCYSDEKSSVDMLYTISVPQYGFCTVPCIFRSCGGAQLAVPHDSDGLISLWNITMEHENNASTPVCTACTCSFSGGKRIKCGMIMCISYRDEKSLAVAFESGHVTLNSAESGEQLSVIRAFAETALACVWEGDILLASSADGQLHCYTVSGTSETDASAATSASLSLTALWEVSLRKGIGSIALQRHLVIVGSWDHTLRLYDAGSGRAVTILTAHSNTVNDICIAPPTAVGGSSFGFDVRRPHISRGSTEKQREEQNGVFLFATASGDYSIAVWRVDFNMLREVAVRKVS